MFQKPSSKSQHNTTSSKSVTNDQSSGIMRNPQDALDKEQRPKKHQAPTTPTSDSGDDGDNAAEGIPHVREMHNVYMSRNANGRSSDANKAKSHATANDASISRSNAPSPPLLSNTSPKYRHPSLPPLRQPTDNNSRSSAITPASGVALGSPSSTSFTGGSSIEAVNDTNDSVNVLPSPSSIRRFAGPDNSSLASGGRNPRRLSKYNKFGTASSGLAKYSPSTNDDDFKYQAHTHYKIKVIATIKCGCCRAKCSQERGGEVYQCTACTAQICRACVEEKLAKEESEAAQDTQLRAEDDDQDEMNDATAVQPYKFEWDGRMKHEGFKLCYLERKINQNGRGDYSVDLALEQIWPAATITPGDEKRVVTVKIFSEAATATKKRKAKNSDEDEPAEGSGQGRKASAMVANKKIRGTKAGTQEEPIDLASVDKTRKREEDALVRRPEKQNMEAKRFETMQNLREHANNSKRPPVAPRIRSPLTGEEEIVMDGQVFSTTRNTYGDWQLPEQQAAPASRRGSAGLQPQMMQHSVPRQGRRPQPVNIMAANAQHAGYAPGTPMVPLTPFQVEVIQRYQQLTAMQTAQFHEMMQSTGLPTPITGTWPSGLATPGYLPRRQSLSQSGQGAQSAASTRASRGKSTSDRDKPLNVTLKARPTSHLSASSTTSQALAKPTAVGTAPRMRPVENTAGLPRHFGRNYQLPTSGPEPTSRAEAASKLDVLADVAAQTAENEDASELARPRRISRQLTDRQLQSIEQKGLRKLRAPVEDDDDATDVAEPGSNIGTTLLRRQSGVNLSDAARVSFPHVGEVIPTTVSHPFAEGNTEQEYNDFGADVSGDDGSESAEPLYDNGEDLDDGDDSGVFNPKRKKVSHLARRMSSNTSTKIKGKGKAPIRPVTADPSSKPPSAAKIGNNAPLRFLAGVPDFAAARNGKTKALKRPKVRTEEDAANEAAMLTGEQTRLVDYGSSSEEDDGVAEAAGEIESEAETDIIGRYPRRGPDEDMDESEYWDEEVDIMNRTPSKQAINKAQRRSGFAKGRSANKAFLAATATKPNSTRRSLKTKSPGKRLGRLRSGKEFTGMGRGDLYDDSEEESDGELLNRGDRGWSL